VQGQRAIEDVEGRRGRWVGGHSFVGEGRGARVGTRARAMCVCLAVGTLEKKKTGF
jgi:hypothetical protein